MKKETFIWIFILFISFYIGFQWDNLDSLRNGVHYILDPTLGKLIEWNNFFGFLIVVTILSLILTLAQKFFTNQRELKRHKDRLEELRKELKNHKPSDKKYAELTNEMLQVQFKEMLPLTMSSFVYTGVPIILFFRWFQGVLSPIYGGWWILYYLIAAMVFSGIFRKVFKTV